ncbi:AfsR/SARP family transcriptional regulator [Kitasatospora sp. NPDC093102]|uniref:AfsR/SARP family transcriptional regulator n=1 Tax=Kitasatospora sp. NPDC093102 TaxID=3155069 RepID=UPI003441BC6A
MALLGPVELVSADGVPGHVPAGKRRAVLALLAAELNRVVPVERFFDLVWDGAPPPQARAALQGHIAALRKLCDGTTLSLETRAPGYLLRGSAELVDAHEFARLAGLAERTEDERAARLLREALGLWRGPALLGVPDGELMRGLGEELNEARVRVVEAWAERLLRLGRGGEAVPELERTLREHELREPLARALMLCLYQEGRQSDALSVYHLTRQRLADELGVTPSAGLQEALATVLADADERPVAPQPIPRAVVAAPAVEQVPEPVVGPGAAVPRQLPRLPGGLVGREAELQWLDLECGAGRCGSGLAVITGPAGVGKTAAVVRWAHAVADAFPDGQLFADLAGLEPDGGADPAEVLDRFLRALGVPPDEIPDDLIGREDLYRALTLSLRLLVVLDNAADADSVRSLIPAGADCSTVVTSRRVLGDLVVLDGAAALSFTPLSTEESLELFDRLVGAERMGAEPAAARRLVDLCDRLPLAMRIAVARLTASPAWSIADLVAELEDERSRLEVLDTVDGASVAAALTATRDRLDPEASRLLALLALHPGAEVDVPTATALLGRDEAGARRALGMLSLYHLTVENSPGRYERHSLVRLYSSHLLDRELTGEQQAAAGRRLLDYYLEVTAEACRVVGAAEDDPNRALHHRPTVLPRLSTEAEVHAWFRREASAIRSLVQLASLSDQYERGWRLADNAAVLGRDLPATAERLACERAGLRAAERSADQRGRARLLAAVGATLAGLGRDEEARAHLDEARAWSAGRNAEPAAEHPDEALR